MQYVITIYFRTSKWCFCCWLLLAHEGFPRIPITIGMMIFKLTPLKDKQIIDTGGFQVWLPASGK